MVDKESSNDITGKLAEYMAEACDQDLQENVALEAKNHILDSVAAMVSGARLKPGQLAVEYVRALGGTPEAQVIGNALVTSAVNAALANGMMGHADETDDTHMPTKIHPGCGIVPAALAMAEREAASGTHLLRAVTLGYDICCRIVQAMDATLLHQTHRAPQGIGPTFGAAAAAGSLLRLDPEQMRYLLSYAAQQASGIFCWARDVEHIEKAFDFGGMGARNGVMAAQMVKAGFTGVWNVLEGEHNLLEAFSTAPRPEVLLDRIGSFYEIANTAIKAFPVGYPIQAALDALFTIMRRDGISATDVDHIVARLPEDGARIVDDREMPDINIQHVLAMAMVDGEVTFASTHSYERMKDPEVLSMRLRVELVSDPALVDLELPRQAVIQISIKDGRVLSHHTKAPPGTVQNPMTSEQVNDKARDLMAPVLGSEHAEKLIDRLQNLEAVEDMRELRPLLSA
ncbi:MAG: MmgE/PrpD family protein [Deltaproteobacteria bacterium]|nr:MmgE/PrpD family protein [Deltaproteobacteria bacterium]